MLTSETVLVTLEKPWKLDKTGAEVPVELVYGHRDARLVRGLVAAGLLQAGEYVDTGSHQDLDPRVMPQIVPGKPITTVLRCDKPNAASAIVSVDAARLWFGDERISLSAAQGTPNGETWRFERERVASRYGYWKLPQRALNGGPNCRKGENDFDLTKIGPPDVPHVRVESIDQAGRVIGEAFRPWDYWKWEQDVDKTHPEYGSLGATPRALGIGDLASFSIDDLEAFVAAQRAKQKKVASG
jgi:hypothetical protein